MRCATLFFVIFTAAVLCESMISDVRNVPLERLVSNLTRLVKEHPRDLEVRVNLARVYAMAYAQKLSQIPVERHEPERWQPEFQKGIEGWRRRRRI